VAASGAADLAGIPHFDLLTPKWGPLSMKVLYVLKKPGTTCPWECAATNRRRLTLDKRKAGSDSGRVEGTPAGHRGATIHLLPSTRLGLWALRLLIAFAALFLTLCALVAAGQTGPWLALMFIPLGLSALLAVATAAVAIVRRGERSVLVFLPLVVGIIIAFFLVGELIGHE